MDKRKRAIRIILLSNWGMQIPEAVLNEVLNALETPDTCPVLGIKLDYDSVDADDDYGYYFDDNIATVIMFDKNERDFNADNLMVVSNRARNVLIEYNANELERVSTFLKKKIDELMDMKWRRFEESANESRWS